MATTTTTSGTGEPCATRPATTASTRTRKATSTGAEPPDILYWALGGGHGHAVRGLALVDRLARRAPGLKSVLVAPERHAAWCARRGVTLWSPPAAAREREPLTAWTRSLPAPRHLVADVFPRGVVGELADLLPRLTRPAWLVSRHVRPRAWLEPAIRAALESHYDRILWCEEPPPELGPITVAQHRIPPILIARPEECLDAAAARAELGLPREGSILMLLGSGSEDEQRDSLRLLVKVCARLREPGGPALRLVALSAHLPPTRGPDLVVLDVFPAMRVLRAATLLVASGGYASWHEAQALKLPAVFLPRARPWDDQARRVASTRPPESPEALEAEISRRLRTPVSLRATAPGDGADTLAVSLVEARARAPR